MTISELLLHTRLDMTGTLPANATPLGSLSTDDFYLQSSQPMEFKERVLRVVKGLIQRANMRNLNTRYIYMSVVKELNSGPVDVKEMADLKKVKFIGAKVYGSIVAGLEAEEEASNKSKLSKSAEPNRIAADCAATSPCTTPVIKKAAANIPSWEIDSQKASIQGNELPADTLLSDVDVYSDALSDRFSSSCIIISSQSDEEEENIVKAVNPGVGADRAPKEDTVGTRHRSASKGTRKREYVPAYRSAPYAVLRALSILGPAHKHHIALKAAPFTDAEFSHAARFSAFGAFKALEAKGLIYSESRSKYYLTNAGTRLCERLFANEAPVGEEQGIALVIDSREKRSAGDRNFFQTFFAQRQIRTATRFLGLGDFVWIKNETVLNCIVERKAGSDFASSISDGRFREQKRRLALFDFRAFYVIENLRVNEINAALCRYCLIETKMGNLTVIETDDINETAELLCILDKKIGAGDFDECMSYGSFLEDGSKQTDPHTILLLGLLSIRGLGRDKAIAIAEKYGTINGLCSVLAKADAENEIARITGKGKLVGRRMAHTIISMFS